MANDSCGDMQMGVKGVALAILAMLSSRVPDFADYENGDYVVEFETHAFYNGRERGVCITMGKGLSGPKLNIVFGEHRSSDDMFVDYWVTSRGFMNGPSLRNFPEAAYKARHFTGYGLLGTVVGFIYDLMEEFYKSGAAEFCRAHGRMIDEILDVPISPEDFEAGRKPTGIKNELDI